MILPPFNQRKKTEIPKITSSNVLPPFNTKKKEPVVTKTPTPSQTAATANKTPTATNWWDQIKQAVTNIFQPKSAVTTPSINVNLNTKPSTSQLQPDISTGGTSASSAQLTPKAQTQAQNIFDVLLQTPINYIGTQLYEKPTTTTKAGETTISAAPKPTPLGKIVEAITTPFKASTEELKTTADMTLALQSQLKAKGYKVDDLGYIQTHAQELFHELAPGIAQNPTTKMLLNDAMLVVAAAGLATNPLGFAAAIPAVVGVGEIENYIIGKLKNKSYQFGAGLRVADLLPAQVSQATKDTLDILEFAAQWKAMTLLGKYLPALQQRLTQEIITKYNLPKTLYIEPEIMVDYYTGRKQIPSEVSRALKDLNLTGPEVKNAVLKGMQIAIPTEKVTTLADRPWWAFVKKIFRIAPEKGTPIYETQGEKTATVNPKGYLPDKTIVFPPEDAIVNVTGSDLSGTPAGDTILTAAQSAKLKGQNVVISLDGKGELVKTPAGNTIGVNVEPITTELKPQAPMAVTKEVTGYRGQAVGAEQGNITFYTNKKDAAEAYAKVNTPVGGKSEVITKDLSNLKFKEVTKATMLDAQTDPKIIAEYDGIKFKDGEIMNYGLFNKPQAPTGVPEGVTKAPEVAKPPTTAETPKVVPKPSKIAKSIETKAVEAKLTKGFATLAEYTPVTIKAQAKHATELVNTDFEKARSIIRGETPLPDNVKGVSLITAMEEHILKYPDAELAYELANSPLVTGTSTAAQELRLAAERVPDSLAAKLQEVKQAKRQAMEKRYNKKAPEAIKEEVVKIKKEINVPDKYDWGAFIQKLEC